MSPKSDVKSYLVLVIASLIGAGLWVTVLNQAYPFVQASSEARSSLTVTTEQQAELKGARNVSDIIGLSVSGAIVALVMVSLAWLKWRSPSKIGIHHLAIAIVAGAVTGAIGGAIGNWFESSPSINIDDPMMFQFARLALMFLPLSIVTGLLTSNIAPYRDAITTHPIGAVVGLVVSVLIYSLLSGTVTPIEGREFVLPHYTANRFLLMSLLSAGMGLGIFAVSSTKKEVVPTSPAVEIE